MTSSRKDRRRKAQKLVDRVKAVVDAADWEKDPGPDVTMDKSDSAAGKVNRFARVRLVFVLRVPSFARLAETDARPSRRRPTSSPFTSAAPRITATRAPSRTRAKSLSPNTSTLHLSVTVPRRRPGRPPRPRPTSRTSTASRRSSCITARTRLVTTSRSAAAQTLAPILALPPAPTKSGRVRRPRCRTGTASRTRRSTHPTSTRRCARTLSYSFTSASATTTGWPERRQTPTRARGLTARWRAVRWRGWWRAGALRRGGMQPKGRPQREDRHEAEAREGRRAGAERRTLGRAGDPATIGRKSEGSLALTSSLRCARAARARCVPSFIRRQSRDPRAPTRTPLAALCFSRPPAHLHRHLSPEPCLDASARLSTSLVRLHINMSTSSRAPTIVERTPSGRSAAKDVEKQEVTAGPAAVGAVGQGQHLKRNMSSRHVAMMCVTSFTRDMVEGGALQVDRTDDEAAPRDSLGWTNADLPPF